MSLIRFDDVSLALADQKILVEADLVIEPNERVCLIGRNGAGKSTTLRLITGEYEPDKGEVIRNQGLVVSQLAQSLPDVMDEPVRDVVHSGLTGIQALLDEYQERSSQELDQHGLQELEALHRQIDAHGGWHIERQVEATISDLNLPADRRMHELSGGWRRRVTLAQALVQKPDLLLLDEPTNHLDIATIKWLENVVASYDGSVMYITHDRAFLERLATRIVEIDRGKLTSWPGDFQNFLRRREAALEAESREEARFDKRLEQEEIWVRQGIKARRTRNEGRVRTLERMREIRAQRQSRDPSARIYIEEAEQSGRKVIRAKNVCYRFDEDEPLIEKFSLKINRGDRIGIIGNNGVGKTTLLRLLLGELEPQAGTIKHGTNLEVAYFNQLREELDPERSVADNVGDGRTYIKLHGKDRHVIGYLKGFLFTPKRSVTPVKALSGGERNRAILAKLFTRPANLLVLDEPTNDLDMETLEVLEDKLVNYSGTLIVVSHDRQFLDNVVTSTIVFEEGRLQEYVGGYSDWVRQGRALQEVDNPNIDKGVQRKTRQRSVPDGPKKLSYNEQRELEQLPVEIERLEAQFGKLEAQITAPDFYGQSHEKTRPVLDQFEQIQAELDQALNRWTELEDRQQRYEESRNR